MDRLDDSDTDAQHDTGEIHQVNWPRITLSLSNEEGASKRRRLEDQSYKQAVVPNEHVSTPSTASVDQSDLPLISRSPSYDLGLSIFDSDDAEEKPDIERIERPQSLFNGDRDHDRDRNRFRDTFSAREVYTHAHGNRNTPHTPVTAGFQQQGDDGSRWRREYEQVYRELVQVRKDYEILGRGNVNTLVEKLKVEDKRDDLEDENSELKKRLEARKQVLREMRRHVRGLKSDHEKELERGIKEAEQLKEESMRDSCDEALERGVREQRAEMEEKYRDTLDQLQQANLRLNGKAAQVEQEWQERLKATEEEHRSRIEHTVDTIERQLRGKHASSSRESVAEVDRLKQEKVGLGLKINTIHQEHRAEMEREIKAAEDRLEAEHQASRRRSEDDAQHDREKNYKDEIKRLKEELAAKMVSEECEAAWLELFRRDINNFVVHLTGQPIYPDAFAQSPFSGSPAENRSRLADLKSRLGLQLQEEATDNLAVQDTTIQVPPTPAMSSSRQQEKSPELELEVEDFQAVSLSPSVNQLAHKATSSRSSAATSTPLLTWRALTPAERARASPSPPKEQKSATEKISNNTRTRTTRSRYDAFPSDVRDTVRRLFDQHPDANSKPRPPRLRFSTKGLPKRYDQLDSQGKAVWDEIISSIPPNGLSPPYNYSVERDKRWDFKRSESDSGSELLVDLSIARWSCLDALMITEARESSPDADVLAALSIAEQRIYNRLFPAGWSYV
ncbi:hypothetical protein IAT40_007508 [Kwoniella sp. CBS 6097]